MKNVLQYLEKNLIKNKDKIAVIDEFGSITYHDLILKSKIVGTYLAKKITINHPIAILMDKSTNCLCSFFGTVYAGCFYTLLNPELPLTRLESIINTLENPYIITNKDNYELAAKLTTKNQIILIEKIINGQVDENLLNSIKEKTIDIDPLYINFTSGSTGTPKGVIISHKSVIDFINEFVNLFNFTKKDIIGNQAPFDFDVSVKDIYTSIWVGATLVIIPRRLFSRPVELLDFIIDNKINSLTWAVSALCLITTFHGLDYKTPKLIKRIIFSGEVMPLKHLNNWMSHLPKTLFVNIYGPTEITCNCTYHIIEKNKDYSKGIPIGKSINNERVFLLDEENNLIEKPNTIGEICVSGTCLALGYYNNPEQTNKAFLNNHLNKYYPEKIYKTGDLAYYNEEGLLIFSGRKDFQIKYQGHRIELEEIEKSMMKINNVERSCVIYKEKEQKLISFYIGNIESRKLREHLKETLPSYMIPQTIQKIENMPLTKNGKIDRKKLEMEVIK